MIEARKETGKVAGRRPRPQLPGLPGHARRLQLRRRGRPPRHHGRPHRQHRLEDEIVSRMGREGREVHQQPGGQRPPPLRLPGAVQAADVKSMTPNRPHWRRPRRPALVARRVGAAAALLLLVAPFWRRSWLHRLGRLGVFAGYAYLAALILLLAMEDRFLYHPTSVAEAWLPPPVGVHVEDVNSGQRRRHAHPRVVGRARRLDAGTRAPSCTATATPAM